MSVQLRGWEGAWLDMLMPGETVRGTPEGEGRAADRRGVRESAGSERVSFMVDDGEACSGTGVV